MNNQPSSNLIQALAVCAELTGTDMSQAAIRVVAQDLAQYPENQVMAALTRCRKELRNRLTIADILSRLDDGRPGPQEAWAIVSPTMGDESITIVWTDEMAQAYGVASQCEDKIAARMAFIESYQSLMQSNRDKKIPVKWTPCLGSDAAGRDAPLLDAATKGRLTHEHVAQFLTHSGTEDLKRIGHNAQIQGLICDFTKPDTLEP